MKPFYMLGCMEAIPCKKAIGVCQALRCMMPPALGLLVCASHSSCWTCAILWQALSTCVQGREICAAIWATRQQARAPSSCPAAMHASAYRIDDSDLLLAQQEAETGQRLPSRHQQALGLAASAKQLQEPGALAEADSFFVACGDLHVHYKQALPQVCLGKPTAPMGVCAHRVVCLTHVATKAGCLLTAGHLFLRL